MQDINTIHLLSQLQESLTAASKKHGELSSKVKNLNKKEEKLKLEKNTLETNGTEPKATKKRALSPEKENDEDQPDEKKRKIEDNPHTVENKHADRTAANLTKRQLDSRNAAFRMFNSFVQQASKETKERINTKKEEIEKRISTREHERDRELVEKDLLDVVSSRKLAIEELEALEVKRTKLQEAIGTLKQHIKETSKSNFLLTQTEPRIYYLPKKLTQTQADQLVEQTKVSHEKSVTFFADVQSLL
jgi:chromosome segregation ATPase